MKPMIHAKNSVHKYGGVVEDYLPVHDFIDSSKMAMPDMRHRAIFHNSFGIYVAERIFGHSITNSDGKKVQTRDIAEDHVLEDLGFIPTIQDYLKDLPFSDWIGGRVVKKTSFPMPEKIEAKRDISDSLESFDVPDKIDFIDSASKYRKDYID